MRWVLDTDVVVAAMRSPTGASAALLGAALDRQIELLSNVALALEYEAVCLRADHLAAAGLTAAQAGRFVDGVLSLVRPVTPHSCRGPNCEIRPMRWSWKPLSTGQRRPLSVSTIATLALHLRASVCGCSCHAMP